MCFKRSVIFFVLLLVACCAFAQCPENIGFELGTLKNWVCYTGIIPDQTGSTPIEWSAPVPPVPGRHQIIKNSSPQILDPYGGFPINAPNSSQYSVQLGNVDHSSSHGDKQAYAEKMTYDFRVPSDDYTLIYYYAVVFQNPPDHDQYQQPQFIANVHNLDNPGDDGGQCGSFSFTASAGLQGFKNSTTDKTVYYKPWSPITIKISGKKNKRFQLEFITRDCSKGGHFGYAYIDFNESNCESPITGNQYCAGQNTVTLTAPAGFETYTWTDASGATVSQTPTLKLSQPLPPDGTQYNLHIIPYTGLGCENAFTTTIQKNNESFNLQVVQNMAGCKADGIDLTQASVTAGSTPGMKYEYYTDPDGQNFISDPKRIVETGDYYIRGTNTFGCTDIAKIHLDLYDGATVTVTPPQPVCEPATIDLTKLVTTNEAGVSYSYYSDALLQKQLTTAQAAAINKTGTYYVKVVGFKVPCVTIKSVDLVISKLPVLSNTPIAYKSCPPLNLNKAIATLGDNGSVTYKFYMDAAGTVPVTNPANIIVSGNYYYKAINEYGCESINKPLIKATVVDPPVFTVTDPAAVVFPQTIDLTDTHPTLADAAFTYWKDAAATKPLDNYQAVGQSGTYYIKAINSTGCVVINPVHVLINAPPEANLVAANTFTPNGDGVNDEFRPTTEGVITLNYIKIFNRYGKEIFETKQLYNRWNGTIDGKPEPAGTYYWVFSAYDIYRKKVVTKSGSVTIIR
ncbi:gliding motility-associated C-terminal domain-containing protein [Mucilaginibacter boryungensis]|uniref:Gliding motility-associated C-terminal domain-containing protein n=1 Tax=Mucilaginibacter boryungensis TaxID=768480 RepID=A0ABR9XDW9_9SPHI|nr:gliding motility-associated C-terminal domain-containing protein [Mucilaginibacter boryungensis]MBE9665583.1 gliding motility-associated C-terminal domain-containing protein [Mucilaginibacter boryungensis]